MELPARYMAFEEELRHVDEFILDQLSKAIEPVKKPSIQLLNSGGKRTRPLLCLLSSCFGESSQSKPYQLAGAIELVHMSSLVHDDIIDRASLRRGQPAIHKQYNNQYATYIGDYLFALSLEIMATLNNQSANEIFSFTLKKLSVGELEQYENRYQMTDSIKMYLKKNRNKTARLIGVSCQLGAILTNASRSVQQLLYQFGYNLGMSYQITDDILDFTERDETLGKQSGQDLEEGYLTLPTLIAIKEKELYKPIAHLFDQCLNNQSVDFKPIINEIKQTNALEVSYQFSQWYLDKALSSLKLLPDIPEKTVMYHIVGYLSNRKF